MRPLTFREKLHDFSLSYAWARTYHRPYHWSRISTYYSRVYYGQDDIMVHCHPDTHRGAVPLYLHFGALHLLVAASLLYLMLLRGETRNRLRMLVYLISPVVALPVLVAPWVLGWCSLVYFVVLEVRKTAGVAAGEQNFVRRLWRGSKSLVRESVQDACGLLLESRPERKLPTFASSTSEKESNEEKEEQRKASLVDGVASSSIYPRPKALPLPVLILSLTALLYLSIATMLLYTRRFVLKANILIEDYMAYLSFVGVLVSLQLVVIMVFSPESVRAVEVTLHDTVPQPLGDDVDVVDNNDTKTNTTTKTSITTPTKEEEEEPERKKPSTMLRLRCSCAALTSTAMRDKRSYLPYRLGRASTLEISIAEHIFYSLLSAQLESQDRPSWATARNVSWNTYIIGFVAPILGIVHALIGVAFYCLHQTLVRTLPSTSTIAPKLNTWIKEQYDTFPDTISDFFTYRLRLPDSVRWVIMNWYFGVWALFAFSALAYLALADVAGLDAQMMATWDPAASCKQCWFDPLAEGLLHPLYRFRGWPDLEWKSRVQQERYPDWFKGNWTLFLSWDLS